MQPSRSPADTRQGGYTLIELVVVLVLVAVLMSLAAPAMSGVIAQNSTRASVDRIVADVSYARILAVREGAPTRLRIESATRYVVEVVRGSNVRVAKTVELAQDYAGVRLDPGTGMVGFDTRGLLSPGSIHKIRVARGEAADSMMIMGTGRPYRAY